MISDMKNQFLPNYAVPPGETLLETIEAIGMSQAELAERTGRPKKTINEIIKGKASITPDTALQLERVLGIPAGFWNNLERNYQETLARLNEEERLKKQISWLSELPINAMIKLNWIKSCKNKVQQLQEVLNFFGVASPGRWKEKWFGPRVSFRKSHVFQSHPGALASWLRKGELDAQKIVCRPFNENQFRSTLDQIRALTTHTPETFQPKTVRLCAESGVAVAFVPELPQIRVNGATWWLNPQKAVIQLSLRYKSDDQLWFSFFHEAGHILLHGKKEIFIEDDNGDIKEHEANNFAANILIPPARLQQITNLNKISKIAIKNFASEIGIAPGIVVGRLQHDGNLSPSHCNDLKRRLRWVIS
ncbi:MAG: HigA family addiction module antitoxin [Candidatus Loosdrechtia sp.]|uniref:HigA family addiction module antitoxin n=1 Tax=Candidatus Loosdrechtia sp. TaxID=3101272 RepID=UPI003A7A9954|nr:MAG: HigA family addiction module antitoxin [Candidatus Jettenia sp. AMX2]